MGKIEPTPHKFRKIIPKIKSNESYINNVDEAKFKTGQPVNVYWTFDFVEAISDYIDFSEIKTILDVGSRDCYQSVEFRTWFPESRIIAFEANPNQIPLCHKVADGHDIEIIPKAASNYNGKTSFFICSVNVGGSSLLQISGHKRSSTWRQTKVEVDCVRIDDWCASNNVDDIDVLWVDVQGAEKMVFEGCGKYLENVKAICTEVELSHMYNNSILKDELTKILEKSGFVEVKAYHMDHRREKTDEQIITDIAECDVIYINKKYLK